MKTIIDTYFKDHLIPLLQKYGVKKHYAREIRNDIRSRMYSLLYYWNDIGIRNTILLPSLEEAQFYLPESKHFVREFVVTTIRNSMLEIAASTSSRQFKMAKDLSSENIREITADAITYFDQFELRSIDVSVPDDFSNVYIIAKHKYPLAWQVLFELANATENTKELDMHFYTQSENHLSADSISSCSSIVVVCDGYTLNFDSALTSILNQIRSGENKWFFVPCFKMISRNFEKICHVLQIILESDATMCTSNYYISRNYIEKRSQLIRAAHNDRDSLEKLSQFDDAPPKLKNALETYYQAIINS